MENELLKFFRYTHLPEKLQNISRHYYEIAFKLINILPDNAERSTALRKLLESKDCAVRSML